MNQTRSGSLRMNRGSALAVRASGRRLLVIAARRPWRATDSTSSAPRTVYPFATTVAENVGQQGG